MKHLLIYITLLVSILSVYGQNTTYYKEIDLYEDARNSGFTMAVDSMVFYVSGKALCIDSEQDTFTCMSLSKYNEWGEVLWKQNLPWTSSANDRSITVLEDSLIVSGHWFRSNMGFNYLNYLKTDGTFLNYVELLPDTTLVNTEDSEMFCNGHLVVDNNIFVYGTTRDKEDSIVTYVIHTDIEGTIRSFNLHHNGYDVHPFSGQDLILNRDSSLAFISQVKLPSRSDVKLITKLDLQGQAIDEVKSPDYGFLSSVPANLTLLIDGSYVYTHNIPFTSLNADFVPQIINSTPTGEIIWTYDYPEEIVGVRGLVNIFEIHTAQNGDIYGCGTRDRLGLEPIGADAYLFRMSPHGEMLWERFYNIALREGERSDIGLRDIAELADGTLVAIGSVSTEEGVLMPIFRVDADGCIEGEDCEETNYLTSVKKIQEDRQNALNMWISPNPVVNRLQLTFIESVSGLVQIFDMRGLQVYSGRLQNSVDSAVDVSELVAGSYAVVVREDSGAIYGVIFVKE